MHAVFSVIFMLFLSFSVLETSAHAQTVVDLLTKSEPANDTSTDTIEDILNRAAEKGVEVILIDKDGNVLSEPATPEIVEATGTGLEHSPLMQFQVNAVKFRSALVERILQLPASTNEVLYILRFASPDGTIWAFGKALFLSLLMFAVGFVVEREVYAKRIMKRPVTSRVMENPQGYIEKMPFLVFRFVAGVGGVLVSMMVAYLAGAVLLGPIEDTAIRFTVILINIGYFSCRVVAGLWRMILSPFLPQYRIPALNDHDAIKLHRWLWSFLAFDICAILFGLWIGELGLNYDIYAFLSSILSAVVVVLNIVMVLVNRRAITCALQNGKPLEHCSWITRFLCRIWLPSVIIYVLFAWVELTYDLILANPSSIPLIAGAFGIVIAIIVVYGLINYMIERSFSRARTMRRLNALNNEEEEQAAALAAAKLASGDETQAARLTQELEDTKQEAAAEEARAALLQRRSLNTFEELARRIAGILAFVAGGYAFFYIWDNDSAKMAEKVAGQLLDILVIIFIGYVIYHAFRIWIDSKIKDEVGDQVEEEIGGEGGGTGASRLATLLPLFRNFILIVVVVTVALIVLMELGVNVGPLFAGAGIVGIAIGFGSQALVRDVFAGAFFLFDDAFRKGEYLDVGDVKGTVEKISVRSFQLRHHLGALHTIPFGELQVITNYSRDWVMMKLPLRVTYDTDVDRVRKLIKKLGQELLTDPVIGENFIQPLKSQGVIEMQDSAMIIRVKFMTKPGDQWLIRKRVFEEIRALFEREGIKFAHREVTVRLADGKVEDLTEEQRNTVTAAAQAALDEDEMPEPNVGDDR